MQKTVYCLLLACVLTVQPLFANGIAFVEEDITVPLPPPESESEASDGQKYIIGALALSAFYAIASYQFETLSSFNERLLKSANTIWTNHIWVNVARKSD